MKDLSEESNDQQSFESYLRNTHLSTLEKNAKHREHKLKKRTKSLLDHLTRLESVEKNYSRALGELQSEKRKYNDLQERKRLDRSEEIEKVEIDLRRVGSSLSVKREHLSRRVACEANVKLILGYAEAEYDVTKSKAEDIARVWQSEWEAFRMVSSSPAVGKLSVY